MEENMATIDMKIIPDNIPVSSGGKKHYCNVSFLLYRMETDEKMNKYEEMEAENAVCDDIQEIKKGPRIVITGNAAPSGSQKSEDALCLANDIPSQGYSFQKPEGWNCTESYNSLTGKITFTITAPVNGGKDFTAAQIRIIGFYTTAQAGVCTLNVKTQNLKQFSEDMTDRNFSVPLSKKYELEILRFTANNLTGKFFLNHKLPVEFSWNAVCDNETPLELMEDDIPFAAVQEFTGEYCLSERKTGTHTYTLKMTLPEGEKTKSIRINDTRWRNINAPAGLTPDFSQWNTMLTWQDSLYLFYNNKLYQSALDKDYKWSDWKEVLTYDGDISYPAVTSQVIRDNKLNLVGGTKEGSDGAFYSVYDLLKQDGWKDYSTGLDSAFADGTAASGDGQESWFVYAKQVENYLFLEQYTEKHKMFTGFYQIYLEKMAGYDICIKDDVLYIAVRNEEEIHLMTLARKAAAAEDAGIIEEAVHWMKWVQGKNNMYLLSDVGLYQEGSWNNVEKFNPPCEQGKYPWIGMNKRRIAGLMPAQKDAAAEQAWATDTL